MKLSENPERCVWSLVCSCIHLASVFLKVNWPWVSGGDCTCSHHHDVRLWSNSVNTTWNYDIVTSPLREAGGSRQAGRVVPKDSCAFTCILNVTLSRASPRRHGKTAFDHRAEVDNCRWCIPSCPPFTDTYIVALTHLLKGSVFSTAFGQFT